MPIRQMTAPMMNRQRGRRAFGADAEGVTSALIVVAVALLAIGVVMAASTSVGLERSLMDPAVWRGALGRQIIYAGIGLAVLVVFSYLDVGMFRWRERRVFQPAIVPFLLSLVLLAAVWLPQLGRVSHGRHRWIQLGSVQFQPSEIAKVSLILLLSAMFSRQEQLRNRAGPGATLPIFAIGLVCVMIGIEDFGTAVLLAVVGGLMLIVGGCRLSALMAWVIPGLAGFAALLVTHPYRVERLTTFMRIWDDPLGKGYHPIQSLVAIASGGWTGVGLGGGLSKHGYLPEARTDFVFSVLCEETGFVGGMVVIGLFVALTVLGIRVMHMIRDGDGGFRRLFVFGVTAWIGLQATMNIAVVTVMAPTKGIALPFVSAGGTGLLCLCAAVGLSAGVARHSKLNQSLEMGRDTIIDADGRKRDIWGVAL